MRLGDSRSFSRGKFTGAFLLLVNCLGYIEVWVAIIFVFYGFWILILKPMFSLIVPNNSTNLRLTLILAADSYDILLLSSTVVLIEPTVSSSLTKNETRPIMILRTESTGFHVSGW